jgi:Mg-chelatase subunit ChlD
MVLSQAVCCSLPAQQQACQRRILPIAFRDSQNLPIQNISPADLDAKVHGKPVKILSLLADMRPHRLVLILDASGSMGAAERGAPRWKLAVTLARHFFAVNRQESPIALIIFNDQVTDAIDFTSGNSAVADKLQQIGLDSQYMKANVKGKTALRDAILQGLRLLDHPTSADAVYVLSDGGDNTSTHSVPDVNQRLAATSVRLFAVFLEEGRLSRSRPPEEESGPGELAEIARKSGGEILSVASKQGDQVALTADPDGKFKTEETLSRLYQTIVRDTLVEIELPLPIAKTVTWELRLSDSARRQWKGAQLTYPTNLLGCASEVYGSGRH